MAANNPVTTIVIGIVALVLGLPVAIAAIAFERPYVRNIVLGSKTIDVGLGRTKTVSFDLLSGPNDAVTAAAFISIISAILVTIGLILIRHITRHNIWGWLAFGPALLNVLGQIGCCAAAYIFQSKYPVETLQKDLKYVNGAYDTNGTLFTKEAWACAMNNLYAAQEGDWANKACSNFVSHFSTFPGSRLIQSRKPAEC